MGNLFSEDDILSMVKTLGVEKTMSYTPSGGAVVDVDVIFFNAFEASQVFGDDVANRDPMVMGRESDFTGSIKNGTLMDGSTTYKILNPKPDGEGWLLLGISEDAA